MLTPFNRGLISVTTDVIIAGRLWKIFLSCLFLILCMHVSVWGSVHGRASACGRPSMSDPRKLELQGGCEPPNIGAGIIGPLIRAIQGFNCAVISPALLVAF